MIRGYLILVLLFLIGSCRSTEKIKEQKKELVIDSTINSILNERLIISDSVTKNTLDSCSNIKEVTTSIESPRLSYLEIKRQIDSIGTFEVDHFPLSNKVIKNCSNLKNIPLGFDGVWFSGDNKTLALSLYTDYHRLAYYHFSNDDIPLPLLEKLEISTPFHDIDNLKEKRAVLDSVMAQNINPLPEPSFITMKQFRLGDNIKHAYRTYGPPDSTNHVDNLTILYWSFIGDAFYNSGNYTSTKPIAINSYGHHVTLFYKEEKLTGLLLENDIP